MTSQVGHYYDSMLSYSHQMVLISISFGIVISLIGIVYVSVCDVALSTLILYDEYSHVFGLESFSSNVNIAYLILISGCLIATIRYFVAPEVEHGGSFHSAMLAINYDQDWVEEEEKEKEKENDDKASNNVGALNYDHLEGDKKLPSGDLESQQPEDGERLSQMQPLLQEDSKETGSAAEHNDERNNSSNLSNSSNATASSNIKIDTLSTLAVQLLPITLALFGGFSVSSEVALTTVGTKLANIVMNYHGGIRSAERRLLLFSAFACSLLVYLPFPLLLVLMMYDTPAYHPGISTEEVTYNYMGVIMAISYSSFAVYLTYYCYLTGDYSFRSITGKLSFLSFELQNSFLEQFVISVGFGVMAALFSVFAVGLLYASSKAVVAATRAVANRLINNSSGNGSKTKQELQQRELNVILAGVCVFTVAGIYLFCPITIGSGWEAVDVLLNGAYSHRRFLSAATDASGDNGSVVTATGATGTGAGTVVAHAATAIATAVSAIANSSAGTSSSRRSSHGSGDIELLSGSSEEQAHYMQGMLWVIVWKLVSTAVSLLFVNSYAVAADVVSRGEGNLVEVKTGATDINIDMEGTQTGNDRRVENERIFETTSINNEAEKKGIDVSTGMVSGGMLLPLVIVGMMCGCLCSALYTSLPVGFCVSSFMLTVPTGVLTLLTDVHVDDWLGATTLASNSRETEATSSNSSSGSSSNSNSSGSSMESHSFHLTTNNNKRRKQHMSSAFSQLTISLISVPLLVVFLGFRQTVPLYVSLLTCYLCLRLVLDHIDLLLDWVSSRSNNNNSSSSSSSSSSVVDTFAAGAGTVCGGIDELTDMKHKQQQQQQYQSTVTTSTASTASTASMGKENHRLRLFSPVSINVLLSTHKKFLLTLLIVCMIRYFITMVLGYL